MVVTNQLKNQHLLWRAGFGPNPEEFAQIQQASQKNYYKALVKASSSLPAYIDVADNVLKGLVMGVDEAGRMQRNDLSDEQKKQLRKKSREDIKNLNLRWMDEMVNSDQQLREKMSLFWHGHFACRNLNIFYGQLLLDVVRKNALGSFADLLRAVSKSGAMINFLNNNQNRKNHPNENFAREVMELFTMGRGNYTENDIKEAARAFTGWGADISGNFLERPAQHDNGTKTFLGKTGNFNGDDILDILLEQKATAAFITRKVFRYFVNEQPDENRVQWLAGRFYQSNYNISSLMEDIFTSDWFYSTQNIGTKIKSPVELVVGIRRMLPMKLQNEEVQLLIQRLLGQILFYPPNVAGWPGGKSWIDSSSLMFRLKLPQLIQAQGDIKLKPKADDDQMMGMKDADQVTGNDSPRKKGQQIVAEVDWALYYAGFKSVAREQLIPEISKLLLQSPSGINEDILKKYVDSGSRESFIRTATVKLMSTPEYQLC